MYYSKLVFPVFLGSLVFVFLAGGAVADAQLNRLGAESAAGTIVVPHFEPIKSVIEFQKTRLPTKTTAFLISEREEHLPLTGGRVINVETRSCQNDLPPLPSGYRSVGFQEKRIMFAERVNDLFLLYKGGRKIGVLSQGAFLMFNQKMDGSDGDQSSHCIELDHCVARTSHQNPYSALGCYSDVREPGCYVNSDWLLWVEEVAKGPAKEKYEQLDRQDRYKIQCSEEAFEAAVNGYSGEN